MTHRRLWSLCSCLVLTANLQCGTEVARAPKPPNLLEPDVAHLPNVAAEVLDDPVFGDYYYVLYAGTDTLAPPLLFIHGLGQNGVRDWYPLLSEFARTRRVVALDLPGFGRSSHNNRYYNPVRYAELVSQLIQTRLGGQVDLVGHSMGGAVALGVAGTRPELIRRLALLDVAGVLCQEALVHEYVNPSPSATGVAASAQRAGGSVLHELMTGLAPLMPQFSEVLRVPELRESLLDGDPERIAALGLITTNFEPILDSVSAPTALIWGSADAIAPLRTLGVLHARLPVQQLTVIPGAGHNTPLEHPTEVASALHAFLGAQNTAPLPKAPVLAQSESEASCRGENGKSFSGRFEKITLDHCQDVRLLNVDTPKLDVRNSTLQGENVRITDGVRLVQSHATLTGGELIGRVAVRLEDSRLDLAGSRVRGEKHAFKSTGTTWSRVVASVVSLETHGVGRSLHGVTDLKPNEEL